MSNDAWKMIGVVRTSVAKCLYAAPMVTIYAATWILPAVSAPIADGAMAIEGAKIQSVGARATVVQKYPAANLKTFDDCAIIPGLVNAHSHLELTAMRGYLEKEETDFFAWLKKLTLA